MKKRIFAAILALMTVVCLLPAAAEATPQPEVTYTDCIKFSSETSFGLQVSGAPCWDGTLEYSHDHSTWTPWDGTVIESSNGKIYLRGTGNSVITGESAVPWTLDGYSEITCTGNIENLLDYAEVATGNHPEMVDFCYTSMFQDCTGLISAPELPATALAEYCYASMFQGCTGLTAAPELNATALEAYCYEYMFSGCTSLTEAPALPAEILTESRDQHDLLPVRRC